jgi:hypothetical protein
LALCTAQFPGRSPDRDASMRSPEDQIIFFTCWCQPYTKEGMVSLEKAARQGHVHAMDAMRGILARGTKTIKPRSGPPRAPRPGCRKRCSISACCSTWGRAVWRRTTRRRRTGTGARQTPGSGKRRTACARCTLSATVGPAEYACHVTLYISDPRFLFRWQHMTRRALTARPSGAASRVASGGRRNGGPRLPRTVAPSRACYSPLTCTWTVHTPARLVM